ncbi:hypothetical protein GT755_12240 [Herbidospora sp. NEAU-GS84]|uniref:Uncharacterized protein n=1 Tax=Herbidospora solisilvae TaxID=2696284 RepID=A0A7C9MWP1_9ACTN|nr:hypothetical protein [Herbidospora solisilvae]NAS22451.1 hypothetical protein [Herbidospora solisilvae]
MTLSTDTQVFPTVTASYRGEAPDVKRWTRTHVAEEIAAIGKRGDDEVADLDKRIADLVEQASELETQREAVKAKREADIAYWNAFVDLVERTVPDPASDEELARIGRPPYADAPDLSKDPDARIARIAALHDAQDAREETGR